VLRKSQFTFILNKERKQPKRTCRVAWRPSILTRRPLHHLIWYCCAVRPKSSDAAMASWFSLLAVSVAAAAIWSLSLAFLSIYCTFIVFLYLWVRACVFLLVHSFFPPLFLPVYPTFLPFDIILSTSLFNPPTQFNLLILCPVLLFSDIFTIPFLMRKEFVNIYHAVCVFSLLKLQLTSFNFAECNDIGNISNTFISNFLHQTIKHGERTNLFDRFPVASNLSR